MKKLLYLLLASLLLASCNTEQKDVAKKYTLNISLDTIVDGYAYLQKRQDGEWLKLDSVTSTDGKYIMSGEIAYPGMHYIYLKGIKRNVPIFLDEGDIVVSVSNEDYDATTITGSAAQDEYDQFLAETGVFDDEMGEIYNMYKVARDSGDVEKQDMLEKQLDEIYEKQQQFIKDYVLEHNTSVASPFITNRNSYSWTVQELENVVNNFDPALAVLPDYTTLSDRIVVLKRVDIGQPLVDFSMKDTNDVNVSLAEVSKGKYMLVDFWASWCGPCRAENPNIVACYNDFHEKGFDVLGVSFDNNRDKWIAAIHKDGLTWNHVSDLQYWDNAAGKLYGVRSIPSSVLLDKDGTIIAKNLRGEELRKKLEELMP